MFSRRRSYNRFRAPPLSLSQTTISTSTHASKQASTEWKTSHTHVRASCGRLTRVSGVCRVHIAITCDRLEWGKAYIQSDNDRLAKFAGDLIPIFSSIRAAELHEAHDPSVNPSRSSFEPVCQPLTRFQSLTSYVYLFEHETSASKSFNFI